MCALRLVDCPPESCSDFVNSDALSFAVSDQERIRMMIEMAEPLIRGFKGILAGDYDHLPEQAFYMVGSIDEAVEKASKLK